MNTRTSKTNDKQVHYTKPFIPDPRLEEEAGNFEYLSKNRSEIYARIAEEIKASLTLIISPIQDKLADEELLSEEQHLFDLINANAHKILSLAQQLSDLSSFEINDLQEFYVKGPVDQFILQEAELFNIWAAKKNILFLKEIEPIEIIFDQNKLESILYNFLTHAFKFSEKRSEVQLRVEKDSAAENLLKIEISDASFELDGPTQNQIDLKESHRTSSLALAHSIDLLKSMGGYVEVSPNQEAGVTFKIFIPIPNENDVVLNQYTGPKTDYLKQLIASEISTFLGSSSIELQDNAPIVLIAEDDPILREYLQQELTGEFEVITAENGEEGLTKSIELIPDLIVSDIMMPKMGGVEFFQKVKDDERISHVPFLFLTAKNEVADKIDGLTLGVEDYLTKPFYPTELKLRIKNLIKKREELKRKLINDILFKPTAVTVENKDDKFLRKVKETIEDNIDNDDFSVVSLQEEIGMSRMQLHRKFRALIGCTPLELIKKFRMERAFQLLKSQQLAISEVAYKVGYSDPSYFAKSFKIYFGKTPSEFMEEI